MCWFMQRLLQKGLTDVHNMQKMVYPIWRPHYTKITLHKNRPASVRAKPAVLVMALVICRQSQYTRRTCSVYNIPDKLNSHTYTPALTPTVRKFGHISSGENRCRGLSSAPFAPPARISDGFARVVPTMSPLLRTFARSQRTHTHTHKQ